MHLKNLNLNLAMLDWMRYICGGVLILTFAPVAPGPCAPTMGQWRNATNHLEQKLIETSPLFATDTAYFSR